MRITVTMGLAVVLVLSMFGTAFAASSETVRVDENGEGNWLFNRDSSTSTPYEFSLDEQTIGTGSLYVLPIGGANRFDKFVAEHFLSAPVADLSSVSYDFFIDGNGDAGDADEFYLNVYTNLAGSSTFYDCRFDYVPTVGAAGAWTTASVAATDAPTRVADRSGDSFVCPATLAGMPDGATVSFFSLNVGSTSASDAGLAGYLDNVVVETTGATTVYDFEAKPPTTDDCKKGGFATYGFSTQGACVAYLQANGNAGK